MDCPRVHERSVSADLTRAGSGDEIGSAPYAILSALLLVFNWAIYAFGKIFSREMKAITSLHTSLTLWILVVFAGAWDEDI